jgi:tetratricopeptide (TPR) repeat protein
VSALRSRSVVLPSLLILGALVVAYASSFAGLLVFDDEPAIATNPHIRHLWPLSDAAAAPSDTTVAGRPVVSLTLALNYALAPRGTREAFVASSGAAGPTADSDAIRTNLWGYHALNLAIHALAALTLFGIARRTLLSGRMRKRFGAAAVQLATCIALLWGVHPVHTGSVTYVVQRAESLMGLFYLLTVYCAIRTGESVDVRRAAFDVRRSARTTNTEPRTTNHELRTTNAERRTTNVHVWSAAAIVACALGMATKESMATAPLIVLAWDWVFGGERTLSRRLPLYAGLASTWLILGVLVAGGHRAHSVGFHFPGWPWWTYLLTQADVVVHYLRLALWPRSLVLDYDWPAAQSLARVAPQAVLNVTLVGLTLWALVRRQAVGFAGAWFFGTLAPTSSVIPIVTEVAAEHRLYLPSAAVVCIVVLGAYAAAPRRFRVGLGVAAAVVVVVFVALTDSRNRDYQSYERIWLDTVQKRPLNARARINYATALLTTGRFPEAESQLREAVRLKPDSAEGQADLGAALCAQGKVDEGIPHLERALAIQPDYAAAFRDLGEAYASRGQFSLAARYYARALDQRPGDVALLNRLGWILATASDETSRDGGKAVALAERAVRLTTRHDIESLDTLAVAYAEADRFEDAIATGSEALTLARAKGQQDIVPELERRLAEYRAGNKVRQ